MIKLIDISKKYNNHIIFENLNLEINKKEFVGIVGLNGVGKTTLINIIAGIIKPDSGTIEYSFNKNSNDISTNIGLQFQYMNYPRFTRVKWIIDLFLEIYKIKIPIEEKENIFKIFKIDEILNKKIVKLSGGQKQRINVLLSILHKPNLLILDEVGTGLDMETHTILRKFILNYVSKQNRSLITISHNKEEIKSLCNRIIVIHNKKIYEDLTKKEIIKKYKSFDKYLNGLFTKRLVKTKELKSKWFLS